MHDDDRNALERAYRNRRWILAMDVLAGATPLVTALRDFGADDVFVIAGSRGTGPAPDAGHVLLGTRGDSVMAAIRAFERDRSAEAAEVSEEREHQRSAQA